ncbi:MAG TPA: nucleotidyltransferase domain-containing protein [Gemmatimonadales bacterium]|nr:nucleotidyltransferase domain-containing protein [Gemmatimonadales bacterium]
MAKDINARIEEFAGALASSLGSNLVSLVLYGSVVRGDYDPKRSDVNLLLILHDASPSGLTPAGSVFARWTREGQPPPLIFSAREWRASTDVFAMEIEDMRQAHRVLRGEDPFAGLETSPADIRDELEREARGKLVHLRAHYAACESDGRALGELLLSSAKTFFVLFRTLLRLKGTVPPRPLGELVRATAAIVEFDPQSLGWVLARMEGHRVPDLKPRDPTGVRYVEAIERVVRFIDEMH